MDLLYHRTSSLLEEVHRNLMKLERSSPGELRKIEEDVQTILNSVAENCERLNLLVNKEVPTRRVAARVQVEQLRYDLRHYQSSLQSAVERRVVREREGKEREELLSRKFVPNEEHTAIAIDHALSHNTHLQGAHRGVDDLLGQGSSVLDNLREQRMTLKGAHKRILDVANTLGLSNTVMRLIEKRTYQDKFVLFGGMLITCVIMFLVVKYIA